MVCELLPAQKWRPPPAPQLEMSVSLGAVEAGPFDRECYLRRLAGQPWASIGFAVWPALRGAGGGGRDAAILKASCAASRYAAAEGLPWPIPPSPSSGLLE